MQKQNTRTKSPLGISDSMPAKWHRHLIQVGRVFFDFMGETPTPHPITKRPRATRGSPWPGDALRDRPPLAPRTADRGALDRPRPSHAHGNGARPCSAFRPLRLPPPSACRRLCRASAFAASGFSSSRGLLIIPPRRGRYGKRTRRTEFKLIGYEKPPDRRHRAD